MNDIHDDQEEPVEGYEDPFPDEAPDPDVPQHEDETPKTEEVPE